MKHPQHIVAFDKALFGLLGDPDKPFTQMTVTDFFSRANRSTFIGRREELEHDERFAQFLPYVVLCKERRSPTAGPYNPFEVFAYQRKSGVGEKRLAGNLSIGIGGHVDAKDVVFNNDSVLNIINTAVNGVAREIDEEIEFSDVYGPMRYAEAAKRPDSKMLPKFIGIIDDRSNEVGRVHLGAVFVIKVPFGFDARCREEELFTLGFAPPNDFRWIERPDRPKLENWTRILLAEDLEALAA